MKHYTKPVVIVEEETAEGIYAASGNMGGVKCDSIYIKDPSNYRVPDYSDWNGVPRSYIDQYGCLGCPSFRGAGPCGLVSDFADSGYAGDYSVDNGNRKPQWEKEGHKADDIVQW